VTTTLLLVTLPDIRRLQVGVEQACDDVTAHGSRRRNSRDASCSDDDDLRRSLKSQDLSSNWQGIATSLSVCLSVCLSVHLSPRVHIQSMAGLWRVVRPNRAADFSGPPPFSLGVGKKLRVAKIFYSFALKSLKLLRPDVIS